MTTPGRKESDPSCFPVFIFRPSAMLSSPLFNFLTVLSDRLCCRSGPSYWVLEITDVRKVKSGPFRGILARGSRNLQVIPSRHCRGLCVFPGGLQESSVYNQELLRQSYVFLFAPSQTLKNSSNVDWDLPRASLLHIPRPLVLYACLWYRALTPLTTTVLRAFSLLSIGNAVLKAAFRVGHLHLCLSWSGECDSISKCTLFFNVCRKMQFTIKITPYLKGSPLLYKIYFSQYDTVSKLRGMKYFLETVITSVNICLW